MASTRAASMALLGICLLMLLNESVRAQYNLMHDPPRRIRPGQLYNFTRPQRLGFRGELANAVRAVVRVSGSVPSGDLDFIYGSEEPLITSSTCRQSVLDQQHPSRDYSCFVDDIMFSCILSLSPFVYGPNEDFTLYLFPQKDERWRLPSDATYSVIVNEYAAEPMLPESGGDISGSIPEHSEHIYAINYTGSGFVEVVFELQELWFYTTYAGLARSHSEIGIFQLYSTGRAHSLWIDPSLCCDDSPGIVYFMLRSLQTNYTIRTFHYPKGQVSIPLLSNFTSNYIISRNDTNTFVFSTDQDPGYASYQIEFALHSPNMEFDVIDVSPFKEFDYYNGPVSVNQFNEARMYAHTFGVNTSFAYMLRWNRGYNVPEEISADISITVTEMRREIAPSKLGVPVTGFEEEEVIAITFDLSDVESQEFLKLTISDADSDVYFRIKSDVNTDFLQKEYACYGSADPPNTCEFLFPLCALGFPSNVTVELQSYTPNVVLVADLYTPPILTDLDLTVERYRGYAFRFNQSAHTIFEIFHERNEKQFRRYRRMNETNCLTSCAYGNCTDYPFFTETNEGMFFEGSHDYQLMGEVTFAPYQPQPMNSVEHFPLNEASSVWFEENLTRAQGYRFKVSIEDEYLDDYRIDVYLGDIQLASDVAYVGEYRPWDMPFQALNHRIMVPGQVLRLRVSHEFGPLAELVKRARSQDEARTHFTVHVERGLDACNIVESSPDNLPFCHPYIEPGYYSAPASADEIAFEMYTNFPNVLFLEEDCNTTVKAAICHRVFRPCNAAGLAQPLCQPECDALAAGCANSSVCFSPNGNLSYYLCNEFTPSPQYCDSPFLYQPFERAPFPSDPTSLPTPYCPPLSDTMASLFICVDGVWISPNSPNRIELEQLPVGIFSIQSPATVVGPFNILPGMNLTFLHDLVVTAGPLNIYDGSRVKIGGNLLLEPGATLNLMLTLDQSDLAQPPPDPSLEVGGCVELDAAVNVRVDTSLTVPVTVPLWLDSGSCSGDFALKVEVTGAGSCGSSTEAQAQRRDSMLAMMFDLGGLCPLAAHLHSPLGSLILVASLLWVAINTM